MTSTAAQVMAAAMSEKDLQTQVLGLCRTLGLMAYHTHDSRRSQQGFPDLVIVGPGGVLFRELKRQTEQPTGPQNAWLDALACAGTNAAVWRPTDLYNGTIPQQLRALTRPEGTPPCTPTTVPADPGSPDAPAP